MKKILPPSLLLLTLAAALLAFGAARAADEKPPAQAKHRVLFEVTMDGAEQWTATLANVENLRKAFGPDTTQVEVVGHSKGLGIMLAKNATLADRMKKLADAGVAFAACENSMRKKNVTRADLLPFVTTVDSGVAEVVRKQEAGWSYIKSGI
jgi:intracellular sulfur oxidation DsrE/DsrF family protein